jgi:hypothetical protein
MKILYSTAAVALFLALASSPATAACNISDAQLEEAILEKPELRDPQNRYLVLDLRTLRDAAYLLWAYGLEEDCERLVGNIRQLIAAPAMGKLGTNDEDAADQQLVAGEPKWSAASSSGRTRWIPHASGIRWRSRRCHTALAA